MSSGRKRVPRICPSCGASQEADTEACFACGRLISALTQGHVLALRYEIQNLLGKGGMGVVYKAHDRLLDEPVAIKVLRSELMSDPDLARRFRSEIKLARKVSHANVCRIHEYGEDGPLSYISMALIEGTDLRKVLRRNPEGLPPDEAFEAAIQASDGLQAIHQVGIIHRDLKTPNIVRDEAGVVRLMDFGIAKEADRNAGFTATGEVMGTPEYMSPEQCRGERLDFRSDVYSMGIVVYEMFTGRVPFHGETVMATLLQQLQEPPPLDGPAAARLPPSVVPVLRRALAKQPADRYPSAAHLAEALRAARPGASTPLSSATVAAEPDAADQPPTVSLAEPPAAASEPASPPRESGEERRRDSRLAISVDLVLVRMGPGGVPGPDERTLADNIGRRGARVLTADDRSAIGDVVRISERGGDFQTTATVRHVSVGVDGIRRLGVEFIDRTAPDRLLPNPEARPRPTAPVPAQREPAARHAAGGQERASRRPGAAAAHAARHQLRPAAPAHRPERHHAGGGADHRRQRRAARRPRDDDPDRPRGRRGGLDRGDRRALPHARGGAQHPRGRRSHPACRPRVPGPGCAREPGPVRSLRAAPTPATPVTPVTPTSPVTPLTPTNSVRVPTPATPVPALTASSPRVAEARVPMGPVTRDEVLAALERAGSRSHFEVLGVAQTATEAEVKEAASRMTRRFHPDVPLGPDVSDLKRQMEAIFIRVTEAHDVLRDRGRRERHERMLGISPGGRAVVRPKEEPARPAQPAEPERPSPPRVSDPESDGLLAESILKEARALLGQQRNWDAIQKLEGAIGLAPGTRVNQAIRLLLAQTFAKNPNWQKRAEEMLLAVIQENPKLADAHMELGALYRRLGLKARAAAQFRMVLKLRPADASAAAELAALA